MFGGSGGISAVTDNPVVLAGSASCLVATAFLAACSLGAVPPLHYGIRYNAFSKYADIDSIYTAGRYFIGPMNSFILFPANTQTIEFTNEVRLVPEGKRFPALHTRTKEGLALHLQVSLQYKLKAQQVGKLYAEFNQYYESVFISTIRDMLIQTAADYEAYQLWEKREAVSNRMQTIINEALDRTYAEVWGLQLMTIELPMTFDQSIVATQVQNQAISTKEYEQLAAQIRASTKVISAEYDKNVTVIRAGGKANYTVITKKAKAEAKSKTLNTEAEVLRVIQQDLHLAPDDLVEYQQFSAIQMLNNASIFYGFDDGTQVLLQQPRALGEVQSNGAQAPRSLERTDPKTPQLGDLAMAAKAPLVPTLPHLLSGEL